MTTGSLGSPNGVETFSRRTPLRPGRSYRPLPPMTPSTARGFRTLLLHLQAMRALLLVFCCGCAPLTVVGAASMTAEALLATRANRAAGGCYATCTAGTTCNTHSGQCER